MTNINKTCELMAKGMTVSKALKEVYKTRKIQIPFNEDIYDVRVLNINLSNRTANALMRSRLTTLRDVINHVSKQGWNGIKNFGEAAAIETIEKMVDIAWEYLDTEERAEFLLRVDEANKPIGEI